VCATPNKKEKKRKKDPTNSVGLKDNATFNEVRPTGQPFLAAQPFPAAVMTNDIGMSSAPFNDFLAEVQKQYRMD